MAIQKKFRARIGGAIDGSTGMVELPFDVKALFGKARPPVHVTIGGHTWQSTVAVYGGKSYLPLRKSNRAAARVTVGDEVEITVALDTSDRTVEAPTALKKAWDKTPAARAAWEALSITQKREHAQAITQAVRPQTRVARLAKILALLLTKEPKSNKKR